MNEERVSRITRAKIAAGVAAGWLLYSALLQLGASPTSAGGFVATVWFAIWIWLEI